MNVLWVCGVLRLEVNDTKASASVSKDSSEQEKFDAWPSREAKNKISHAFDLADKYDNIVQNGGELPDNWWEYDSDATTTLLYPSDEEGN
jgi:3-methyladenine DNA glycosylase/8-oxoguanine DNA glycosylase